MTQSSVTNNQNYMYNKINCYLLGFKTQEIQRVFVSSENKSIQVHSRTMAHTVQLLNGMMHAVLLHCPINAEIRTVDSQSDLRILL